MFSSLASFLLGNVNRNATNIEDQNQRGATHNNFKFVSTNCKETDDDEDNEWVLVEKGDGDCTPQQTDSEEEIPFIEIKNSPTIRTRHSRNNSNVGSQDGANYLPSSPQPSSMDESWYVTPPPCFMSTGSVSVQSSPIENLLIEHPSMSVYHSIRNSLHMQREETEQNELVVVDLNDNNDDHGFTDPLTFQPARGFEFPELHPAFDRTNSGHTMRVARNRNDAVIDALAQPQVKQAVAKHSRRGNDKNARQLCRNAMERNNKVREVNNKGGRQKRNDMTHCKVISRANNNRKC